MKEEYEDAVESARAALHHALRLIADELRDYPTPVAGCDVQYTHLLSEQSRISAALSELGATPFIPTPRTLTPRSGVESR